MENIAEQDFNILVNSRSWKATPWEYSSLIFFRVDKTGAGQLIYGYGQTIYANIKAEFSIEQAGVLIIHYFTSDSLCLQSEQQNKEKVIEYKLIEEENIDIQNIVPEQIKSQWKLELSLSIFPDSIQCPYGNPLTYYGYLDYALNK